MTLISRENAIERIANDNVVGGMKRINEYRDSAEHNDYLDGISTAIATVDDLPSAEAEWIPCSERLPSNDESVIVSVLDDHGDTPWKYTTVAWRYNGVWISDNDILCGTTVAWMPLPKPYREDSEV